MSKERKLYQERLEQLKKAKSIKDSGGYNAIPFPFPKFNDFIPGIMRRTAYILTANSSVGKSRWLKYAVLLNIFYFKKNIYPELDIKIFYFTLEESKETLIDSLLCMFLYRDFGIEMDTRDLNSLRRTSPDSRIIKMLEGYGTFFDEFFDFVELYDGHVKPYKIKDVLEQYAQQNGKYIYEDVESIVKDGEKEKRRMIVGYKPDNPDQYVLTIVDPINLLGTQRNAPTLKAAIDLLTAEYMIEYRDICGYTFFLTQQQGADSEGQQYTNKGELIVEKLYPTLANLGDSRTTARDADIVIGLFSPDRYGLKEIGYGEYMYDLSFVTSTNIKLGKYFRQMTILKDRNGVADIKENLYFNGLTNVWSELPAKPKREIYTNYHSYNKVTYNYE